MFENENQQISSQLMEGFYIKWSFTYLYFGNDVCYFNYRILSNGESALCVHLAVHPAHAFTHTLLHRAHFLSTQMQVSLVLGKTFVTEYLLKLNLQI